MWMGKYYYNYVQVMRIYYCYNLVICLLLFCCIGCKDSAKATNENLKTGIPPNPKEYLFIGTNDTLHKEHYFIKPVHVSMGYVLFPSENKYFNYYNACLENNKDSGRCEYHGDTVLLFSTIKNTENSTNTKSNKPTQSFLKRNGQLISLYDSSFRYYRSSTENNRFKILSKNGNGYMLLVDHRYEVKEFGYYENFELVDGCIRKSEYEYDTIKTNH
jgi:hypothetical protein